MPIYDARGILYPVLGTPASNHTVVLLLASGQQRQQLAATRVQRDGGFALRARGPKPARGAKLVLEARIGKQAVADLMTAQLEVRRDRVSWYAHLRVDRNDSVPEPKRAPSRVSMKLASVDDLRANEAKLIAALHALPNGGMRYLLDPEQALIDAGCELGEALRASLPQPRERAPLRYAQLSVGPLPGPKVQLRGLIGGAR